MPSGRQLAQDVLQDAAVEEIFEFVDGIDPAAGLELLGRAVGADEGAPSRPDAGGGRRRSWIVKVSLPSSFSVWRVDPFRELERDTPMPTRFERWMRSKLSVMTARTPSRLVPFAAQSRDEPVPYSLPAMMTSGVPSAL